MILTLILLLVSAAVLAAIFAPLWRRMAEAPARARFDRAVYRDQLAEVERDVARGLVPESDAAGARREIERRILAAADEPEQEHSMPRRGLAAILSAATLVVAFALYLGLGTPGLPDMPFAHRIAPEQQQAIIRGMVDSLAARLQQKPDDVDGWMMLGRSYAVLGDSAKAVDAYEHAHQLNPDDNTIALREAEILLSDRKLEDAIPERAIALLRGVEARDPDQPTALWYLGMASAQKRDFTRARLYWTHLLRVIPANAPERKTVSDALAAIEGKR